MHVAPTEPFAVAMFTSEATSGNGGAFYLCPIEGKTFVCGSHELLVADGGTIQEAHLEAGIPPDQRIVDVLGTWPNDAWLVTHAHGGECYQCEYVAYRWRGRRWQEVERFTTLIGVKMAVWREHLVVLDYDDRSKTPPTRKLTVIGEPRVRLPHPSNGCAEAWALNAIAATADSLFASWSSCALQTGIEQWSAFDAPGRFEVVRSSTTDVRFTVLGPHEVMAYGMRFEDRGPFMMHFDGARWQTYETPQKDPKASDDDVFSVYSYARAPNGIEWALFDEHDSREVWTRVPHEPWKRLEGWRAATRKLGEEPTPTALWIADGSVWLDVFVSTNCSGEKGCDMREALLRTGMPAGAHAIAR
jgi:hypothetical protein